uniref:Acyl-CoA dehydrogenase n=1 Tax=Haemonchus placei TaxID=6290 RepID=A0A0N4VZR3_HAEPC
LADKASRILIEPSSFSKSGFDFLGFGSSEHVLLSRVEPFANRDLTNSRRTDTVKSLLNS